MLSVIYENKNTAKKLKNTDTGLSAVVEDRDMKKIGKVYLAGAGPGDAGLLTVKTVKMLREADVIVYDALISEEILCRIPEEKELIYVGKRSGNHAVPQDGINRILLEGAQKGKTVLRLKGGDPFVFGRGGEELELLLEAGIPFEIIPGVTSAAAVPAYAGIPVTHRDYTSSFHVITGHRKKDNEADIDFASLVKLEGTLVFLMGLSSLGRICRGLLDAGMKPDMPAAVLERGTTSRQRRVVSDVGHLEEEAEKAGIGTPAIIIAGRVCGLSEKFHWAEDRPLGGRQFLITRPKQNISRLAEILRNYGAQVLELPAIQTFPLTPNKELSAALDKFAQTGEEAWLVFTSPIGVQVFFDELARQGIDLRLVLRKKAEIKFAVIGNGTKTALRGYGITADLMPEIYDAVSLGNLLAETAAHGSEILIVRAAQGSEELIPPLLEKGCRVSDIPLYETRSLLHEAFRERIGETIAAGEVDAVLFTSASTVRGFVQNMCLQNYDNICAVCIGKQTAQEAARYGMDVVVSERAAIDSMVQRVLEMFSTGGQHTC